MTQTNGHANGNAAFTPPFEVTEARPKDVGIRKSLGPSHCCETQRALAVP